MRLSGIPRSFFHPPCTTPLENFHPNRNFFLLNCIFQHPASEIARAVGRSVQRVSTVLSALRLAEVVRYDTDGKRNLYRLKHPNEVRGVFAALSRFVKIASAVSSE